jgi:hypothetical protein
MSNIEDILALPALSTDDQKLIEAYSKLGVPLDDLPYTEEFEQLGAGIGIDANNREGLHQIFKRLLTLRKNGRLPRVYAKVA